MANLFRNGVQISITVCDEMNIMRRGGTAALVAKQINGNGFTKVFIRCCRCTWLFGASVKSVLKSVKCTKECKECTQSRAVELNLWTAIQISEIGYFIKELSNIGFTF